jgi:peptide-methionine (S)-S-oxide reductase
MKMKRILLAFCGLISFAFCAQNNPAEKNIKNSAMTDTAMPAGNSQTDTATFGTGCFWCTEAIFQQVDGVYKVTSGYSGGFVENPDYKEVCNGTTGHAECLRIEYNPAKVSYDELLEIFWQLHDPTTLNRQGADVGTQYRSVVFYHNADQKAKAEHYKTALDKSGAWDKPIVTTIEPMTIFYPAEAYHQNYYNDNPGQGYCQFVIRPKVEKFQKVFKDKLKKSAAQ